MAEVEQAWTPEQVAERLQLNPEWIRDQISAGRIGCLRANRRSVRLLQRHVDELIRLIEVPAKQEEPDMSYFGATRRSVLAHQRKTMRDQTTTDRP